MTDIQRLNWGCSDTLPSGWINADVEEGPGIDISCDIALDGLPLESDSIDYVCSQHALQRLRVYDVVAALRELRRVLKPGGALRLGLADLDRAIDAYTSGRQEDLWCRDWRTLGGNAVTQLTEYGYLLTPLNYAFAEELLQMAGFGDVRRVGYRETSSAHLDIVALDRRPEDSFFVEATKPARPEAASSMEPGRARQIHLSWAGDPSTSLAVVWHTPSEDNPALVEYRALGEEAWGRAPGRTKSSPGTGHLHQAAIADLRPATRYEYRVSNDRGVEPAMSEAFRTRTAPPPGPADFHFAFVCDTGLVGRLDGNATGTAQVIDEMIADDPLFVLGGGDYAYANRDDRYEDVGDAIDAWFVQMQPLLARTPFMAQYGNHEVVLGERFRDWAPRFAHPKGFDQRKNYSFDVGDVHFTSLFVPGPLRDLEQLVWLDADLAEARRRGMRWLIVYQHEPIYGHGHSHPARAEVRKVLAPIFERYGVDLHLSGHDQNYERTYPLIGVPDHPTPASSSLDHYEAGQGVIYAKVSPGGKMSEIRNGFSRFTTVQQPFVAVRDDTAHHYARIDVRASGRLEVAVYSVSGDGAPKTTLDAFCINAIRLSRDPELGEM